MDEDIRLHWRIMASQPGRQDIERQLARILTNELFSGSATLKPTPILQELLRYIIEGVLERNPRTEAQIGMKVFGRSEDWSPYVGRSLRSKHEDTIVRSNVARLKKQLEKYYQGPGRTDPVLIEFVKGKPYEPSINFNSSSPAHTLYELALSLYHRPEAARQALDYLKEAIAMAPEDPSFYAEAGRVLSFLGSWEFHKREEYFAQALSYIKTSIHYSSEDYAPALLALAGLQGAKALWRDAEKLYKVALDADREATEADNDYHHHLMYTGREQRALELSKAAMVARKSHGLNYATFLYWLRRYDEAIALLEQIIATNTRDTQSHDALVLAYLAAGKPDAALNQINEVIKHFAPPGLVEPGLRVLCLARAGYMQEAKQEADRLFSQPHPGEPPPGVPTVNSEYQRFLAHLALKDIDAAVTQLACFHPDRSYFFSLHLRPELDPLRGHPFFQHMLKRVKPPRFA